MTGNSLSLHRLALPSFGGCLLAVASWGISSGAAPDIIASHIVETSKPWLTSYPLLHTLAAIYWSYPNRTGFLTSRPTLVLMVGFGNVTSSSGLPVS